MKLYFNVTLGPASIEPKADSSTNVVMPEIVEPDGQPNNSIVFYSFQEILGKEVILFISIICFKLQSSMIFICKIRIWFYNITIY